MLRSIPNTSVHFGVGNWWKCTLSDAFSLLERPESIILIFGNRIKEWYFSILRICWNFYKKGYKRSKRSKNSKGPKRPKTLKMLRNIADTSVHFGIGCWCMNTLFDVFSSVRETLKYFFSTLRSLINVRLCLLIWKLLIQGYFLIREATFINFQIFFQELYFFYFDNKKMLNVLVHED